MKNNSFIRLKAIILLAIYVLSSCDQQTIQQKKAKELQIAAVGLFSEDMHKNAPEALRLLDSALLYDTMNPYIYQSKTAILQSMDKHEEAIQNIRTRIRIFPDSEAEMLANIGSAFDKIGNKDSALIYYSHSLTVYKMRPKRIKNQDIKDFCNILFLEILIGEKDADTALSILDDLQKKEKKAERITLIQQYQAIIEMLTSYQDDREYILDCEGKDNTDDR